jgi:hypothetical protein
MTTISKLAPSVGSVNRESRNLTTPMNINMSASQVKQNILNLSLNPKSPKQLKLTKMAMSSSPEAITKIANWLTMTSKSTTTERKKWTWSDNNASKERRDRS